MNEKIMMLDGTGSPKDILEIINMAIEDEAIYDATHSDTCGFDQVIDEYYELN